ncbi:DsbA family protein [Capillimicrobium parvum]|uniref:DsbA family protein n=1 Tax=Capillimicrobium parvum TaxID=2884022 RepID=UPI00216B4B35|nr:DsbA family protein [Capillimicrobium parvum]
MGTLIDLASRRRQRAGAASRSRRATFFFDLADPATYLAAERVEQLPAAVIWQPAVRAAPPPVPRAELEERADRLRMPLVWPEPCRAAVPRAMRAAAHAAAEGRGGAFVLAASRLAFCGGFDLDDPEVLAEAAAAAGLALEPALAAAGDPAGDDAVAAAGRSLAAHGAVAMPVVRVGRLLFPGEDRIAEAAAALRVGHGRRAQGQRG